jgi:hypothetical protein
MDAEFNDGPDDGAALRQALTAARAQALAAEQKHLDTVAELAVAKAMTSDDKALIAHQALRIAKLERQLYGPRKERAAQLQDLKIRWNSRSKNWRQPPPRMRSRRSLLLPKARPWGRSCANAPRHGPPFPTTCPESAW